VEDTTTDRSFYAQWVVANGLAESAGLGTTFLLGATAAPFLVGRPTPTAVLAAAVLAVVLGMILEGVVVGLAQGVVLRRRAPKVGLRPWVVSTAIGAGLAWLVGMIPSSAMALADPVSTGPTMEEPGLTVQLFLAAGLGLATGPILGVAQWAILRRRVAGATSWLWANALAWALGMPVIFAGMDLVPWEGAPALKSIAIFAVCLVAGLVVGAVHGLVLLRLTQPTAQSAAAV
jgi:hypothetical protein